MQSTEVYPGAFHFQGYFSLEEQKALVHRCKLLGSHPAGFYTPVHKSGAYMRIQMFSIGMHWNPITYKYEKIRSDHDGLAVQELPEDLKQLAKRIADEAAMQIDPDICILNFYNESGKLGLHQDKDEKPDTIRAGIPVVSISLGDSCEFLMGGTTRKDRVKKIPLSSGDAFLFGGVSRLRYHGVSSILPGTAPLDLEVSGRYNLTFRQY